MANFNSGKKYNLRSNVGGANYNSAPFYIIVLDSGSGVDHINSLFSEILVNDSASIDESVAVVASIETSDHALSSDAISLTSNIVVDDFSSAHDALNVSACISIDESGIGQDNISVAGAFFVIDSNNILQPLGVLVMRDSRYELLPATRDITDEIPGMHGEFDFGSEFQKRTLELHVATKNGYTPLEKSHLQRIFAKYLDPTKGTKTLIFSDDIEKTYVVKYSGKIDITQHPTWFEFVLPFKMSNPFIMGSFEKTLTGSGTLVNNGTYDAYLEIEIAGPSTNPSIVIGGQTLSYTGTIPSGQKLSILSKGGTGTVKLNGQNAMAGYNGVFPALPPGETSVTASGNVTIRWRDMWL